MRILHVAHSIDPSRGGPPVVVARLASEQAIRGHDVFVAACHGISNEHASGMFRTLRGGDQVQVLCEPLGDGLSKLLRASWPHSLDRVDFVHLHEFWVPGLWSVAAGARRRSIPYGLSPHGTLGKHHLAHKSRKKEIGLLLGGSRMIRGASFIQAFTAIEADEMRSIVADVPIAIIPNGVEIGEFSCVRREIGAPVGLGVPESSRYLLFLARVSPQKGVDILIDAFRRVAADHPDVHLVIAGPDYGAMAKLQDFVKLNDLDRRVHFPGPISGSLKYAALSGAWATCLISHFEGFSMTLLESLAAGTPVIASDRCNFPEISAAGVGIVVQCEVANTEASLRLMLSDHQLRHEMASRCREFVASRYSVERVADAMHACYEQAVNQRV